MSSKMLDLSGIVGDKGVPWLIRKGAKLVRILGKRRVMINNKVVIIAIVYDTSTGTKNPIVVNRTR